MAKKKLVPPPPYVKAPAPASNDRGGDRIVAKAPTSYTGVPDVARAPAAPAAPASTMSDKFITRYDRDVQDGKVKTVAKKPVTTTKKVKAI